MKNKWKNKQQYVDTADILVDGGVSDETPNTEPKMHQVFKVQRGSQSYQVIVEGSPEEGLQKIQDIEPKWAVITHLESCADGIDAYLEANKNRHNLCARSFTH